MTRATTPLWPRAATPTNDLLLCYGKLSDLHRVVLKQLGRAIKSTGTQPVCKALSVKVLPLVPTTGSPWA